MHESVNIRTISALDAWDEIYDLINDNNIVDFADFMNLMRDQDRALREILLSHDVLYDIAKSYIEALYQKTFD